MEQTIQCPICKQPYKVYSHYAGDQTACPSCRRKADRNSGGRIEDFRDMPRESQQDYFGIK